MEIFKKKNRKTVREITSKIISVYLFVGLVGLFFAITRLSEKLHDILQ